MLRVFVGSRLDDEAVGDAGVERVGSRAFDVGSHSTDEIAVVKS